MVLPLFDEAHACGKVILLGEHAVVYGYPALAAGVPGSLTLRAKPLETSLDPIRVRVAAWNLDVALHPDTDHPVARACLDVLSFCDGPVTGWAVDGETTLPSAAGLGSSAALTVAMARLALGPDADAQTVVEASMTGERVFHGQPSGIDSEVAARGGLLRFVRGEPVEPIELRSELPLVIVHSRVPRSTATQVAKVRARHDRFPTLARPMLELCGVCVGLGLDAISRGDLDTLGEIMNMNHELLGALDVSSSILDELCSVARSAGARGAKLTGAGGGGCILALPADPLNPVLDAFTAGGWDPLVIRLTP